VPTTTVHLPDDLLRAVDARARAEGVSRNRFITLALQRAVDEKDAWSPAFLALLRAPLPPGTAAAADRMLQEIVAHRSSKARAPRL
jgi:hypothetical protein